MKTFKNCLKWIVYINALYRLDRNLKLLKFSFSAHIYLFLMNKCLTLNDYNLFHTYDPVTEIVKS